MNQRFVNISEKGYLADMDGPLQKQSSRIVLGKRCSENMQQSSFLEITLRHGCFLQIWFIFSEHLLLSILSIVASLGHWIYWKRTGFQMFSYELSKQPFYRTTAKGCFCNNYFRMRAWNKLTFNKGVLVTIKLAIIILKYLSTNITSSLKPYLILQIFSDN